MKKAICDKCNSLIEIDESNSMVNCPKCNEQLFTDSVIKNYYSHLSMYRHKADSAFVNLADYELAYKNYKLYYNLNDADLGALLAVSISLIRCSNFKKITIKDAIDFTIEGSEKVEITFDNVNTLNESLGKMKKDVKLIVDTFNEVKDESLYALNMYQEAIKQNIYFLKKLLEIYLGLDQFNKYLSFNESSLNGEINGLEKLLKEKINVKNNNNAPHDFYDKENKLITKIFVGKKKMFQIRKLLIVATVIGAILSVVGLILVPSLKENPVASYVVLSIGLLFFFGGYFLNHYLTRKNKQSD